MIQNTICQGYKRRKDRRNAENAAENERAKWDEVVVAAGIFNRTMCALSLWLRLPEEGRDKLCKLLTAIAAYQAAREKEEELNNADALEKA